MLEWTHGRMVLPERKKDTMSNEHGLTKSEKQRLRWIVDPGHAWLRVPYRLCESLPISEFSFHDDDRKVAWLEQDEDAGLFLDTYGVSGRDIPTSERAYEWTARYSLSRFVTLV